MGCGSSNSAETNNNQPPERGQMGGDREQMGGREQNDKMQMSGRGGQQPHGGQGMGGQPHGGQGMGGQSHGGQFGRGGGRGGSDNQED